MTQTKAQKYSVLSGQTFLKVLCLFFVCAWYSTAAADEESLAGQSAQAGNLRDALIHYVAALQSVSAGSAKDVELRKQIIKLVRKIRPPPAVPEGVLKFEGRAEAAVRNARTPEDYLDASREYRKALLQAPWMASYYFNLGVVLEKAGKPDDAIGNFELYLVASPGAQDAREVRKRIAGLEYELEKQGSATVKQAQQIPDVTGVWSRLRMDDGKWLETVEIRIMAGTIETRQIRSSAPFPPNANWVRLASDIEVDGKVITSHIPVLRYGNRTKNWKVTLVSADTMIEEWFYEGGEGAKRFQDGAMRDYITNPEWFRVEWKRER